MFDIFNMLKKEEHKDAKHTFSWHPRDRGFLTSGSVLHCSIGI